MKNLACVAIGAISLSFFFDSAAYAITPEQCSFFASDEKVTICHATGSSRNPFVILRISTNACTEGHADHAADFVSVGDPTCRGAGCLPESAPCDATVPCCDGLACSQGSCVRAVVAPTISPTSGARGTSFTITDPQGRVEADSIALFYKPGQDPANDGVEAENVTISGDGTTLTGLVPCGALGGETFVSIRSSRAASAWFDDLPFTIE